MAALVKVQHLNPPFPPVPAVSNFLSFLRKFVSDIMQKWLSLAILNS